MRVVAFDFANFGFRILRLNAPGSADDVDIAGHTMPIILSQVIEIGREVFIESLTDAHRKTISHPGIETPIVEYFVGNKEIELVLLVSNRVVKLQLVTIAG